MANLFEVQTHKQLHDTLSTFKRWHTTPSLFEPSLFEISLYRGPICRIYDYQFHGSSLNRTYTCDANTFVFQIHGQEFSLEFGNFDTTLFLGKMIWIRKHIMQTCLLTWNHEFFQSNHLAMCIIKKYLLFEFGDFLSRFSLTQINTITKLLKNHQIIFFYNVNHVV